ncbi:MAG: aldo/keto reductase, partial [Kiritimatiellae bacterium]|nr:aldo/keto reductase [Kiritimatiellia bacterium]
MFGNETANERKGSGAFGSVSRRGFVAGAAALATLRTRADWLKFFRRDREEPENFHVLHRPFGSDPSREISLLGCGGVRLCVEHNNQNKIDRELATEIFDYSYRHGVNFFDTGYVYHGGDSEKFLNEILVK